MQSSYNYYLVALSYAIAAYASYTALSISSRLIHSQSKLRWLLAGSVSMESGGTFFFMITEPHNLHVLIVDDNKANRQILEAMPASWNISYESPDSGEACLNKSLNKNTIKDILKKWAANSTQRQKND